MTVDSNGHLAPPESPQPVRLRATAYSSREQTLTQLRALVLRCRGFLLAQPSLNPAGNTTLEFEVPFQAILDLYGGLLAADLDFNRDSHLQLTGLCTLRRYHTARTGNISLQLELDFADDTDPDAPSDDSWPSSGFA